MSADLLLTFNAGSSSIKIGLLEHNAAGMRRVARGVIDFRKPPLTFAVTEGPATFKVDLTAEASQDMREALTEVFAWLAQHFDMTRLTKVGHRVVHGGDTFSGPIRIDGSVIEAIDKLTILAPLHQPQSLRLIRAIGQMRPDIAQSASFDTAFHRSNSELVRRFAIPRRMHDAGIKRYGFHGLSYKFIAAELKRRAPDAAKAKVIVAHLGSGASLCALDAGTSRDTSMGFSTLDGIPMATRCGALDPGVLLHWLGPQQLPLAEVEDILYHRSGLLGVSGISADSRALLGSDRPEAREAIDLFTFRIAGEIARLATTLGGFDAIVFTAGIGENQPPIRAGISQHLAWLGLALDPAANAANAETIAAANSRVAAFVIATDEEQVIADEALAVLGYPTSPPVSRI
jgi:acetate kinase